MSPGRPTDPLRLGRLIDSSRRQQDLGWAEFAKRAGVSRTTLNDIRNGKIHNIQPLTKTGIERAARWCEGDVDVVLDDGDPTPLSDGPREPVVAQASREPLDVTFEDALATYNAALVQLWRITAADPGVPHAVREVVEDWNMFANALAFGGPAGVRKAVGLVADRNKSSQLGEQDSSRTASTTTRSAQ